MVLQGSRALLGIGFFVFSVAQAQIAVRVDKPAKLFAQPSERAMVLTEIGGRSSFRALEQSPDRLWVFISDGMRYGWIRKVFVKSADEAATTVSEAMATPVTPETKESVVADNAPPDKDLPDQEDLDDALPTTGEPADEDTLDAPKEEAGSDAYLITQPGTFFETPKRNSQRFGKLEPNDQVELMQSSEDGKWSRVRLVETGEEGWVPRSRVGRKVPRNELKELEATSGKNIHIGFSGVAAPLPWNYGFLASIRRGFSSLSIGDTPVEFGIGAGLNMGTTEQHFNTDLKVTYLDMRFYTHWEPLLSPRFGLPIELGMLYKYGSIQTELSEAQYAAITSRILQSEFGGFVGVGLTYFLFDSLRVEVVPQIQLTSSVDFVANAGLVFSF